MKKVPAKISRVGQVGAQVTRKLGCQIQRFLRVRAIDSSPSCFKHTGRVQCEFTCTPGIVAGSEFEFSGGGSNGQEPTGGVQ